MMTMTPRWEWRSFGLHFGQAEKHSGALPPQDVQESDEFYLLTADGGNVKVRAALMDIKALQQVNADGPEQWVPVLKAEFSLAAADLVKVFDALRLPLPAQPRAAYSMDEFIATFAAPGSAIRCLQGHKRRTRYTVGGCMAARTRSYYATFPSVSAVDNPAT